MLLCALRVSGTEAGYGATRSMRCLYQTKSVGEVLASTLLPMPYAPYPVSYALCPMPYAPYPVPYPLSSILYPTLYPMSCVGCPTCCTPSPLCGYAVSATAYALYAVSNITVRTRCRCPLPPYALALRCLVLTRSTDYLVLPGGGAGIALDQVLPPRYRPTPLLRRLSATILRACYAVSRTAAGSAATPTCKIARNEHSRLVEISTQRVLACIQMRAALCLTLRCAAQVLGVHPVSYTHLTLPTICSV
eukprot:1775348-Rhodomonas_salina.2